ncbi:MAG: LuxR C-terminal-related transcriptional regulator [Treponemataceae bacterium]|nr:LuxR C-terminal-related transcriptional regulator [Treponemataceae bacterium]
MSGVVRMLKEGFRQMEVLCAGSFEEVRSVLYERDVDLLVIEKITLGFDIEDRTGELMRMNPCLRILCFCLQRCGKNFGLRMYRAGIKGLFVDCAFDMKLMECVGRLLDGKTAFPVDIEEGIRKREHILNSEVNGKITGREMEVLRQMLEGSTLKQGSDQMHIAVGTLSSMRSRVVRKLGAESFAEAIIIALQYGLGRQQA